MGPKSDCGFYNLGSIYFLESLDSNRLFQNTTITLL